MNQKTQRKALLWKISELGMSCEKSGFLPAMVRYDTWILSAPVVLRRDTSRLIGRIYLGIGILLVRELKIGGILAAPLE